MGTRTGNPTWQNFPSTATLINAARLNAIETAIDGSAAISDAVPLASSTPLAGVQNGYAGTDAAAAHGLHRHPLPLLGPTISWITGRWATPQRVSGTGNYSINRVWVAPYWLVVQDNRPAIISALGVSVTGAGSSDSTVEVGLYASQPSGYPDLTQKLTSTTITTAATTGDKATTLGSNYTFPNSPGLYWAAGIVHGTTSPTFNLADSAFAWPRILNNEDTNAMIGPRVYATTSISSLPTTQITLNNGNEDIPALFIKMV